MSKRNKPKWYKLDTSAKIYPAVESTRNPEIFRITMQLSIKIDEDILLRALKQIKKRFPYYNVHLKKGLFWYYIQQNDKELIVWPDTPSPCEKLYPIFNNGYLYRVKFFENNLSVEFFHVLTDGTGALEFLKTLVHQYLVLNGKIDGKSPGIINVDERPTKEESEDAFLKAYEADKDEPVSESKRTLFGGNKMFQIRDKLLPMGIYKVITGIASMSELKRVSKKFDATVTELLASLYIEALVYLQAQQIRNKKKHKNVSVQVPVNMRKFYRYRCMRNFSLFVIPTVDPRKINHFADIVSKVKDFMKRHLTHEHLITMIRDNCSLTKHNVIKYIPLDIKNLVIRYINNTMGASQFSGTLSNLGLVKLPDEMAEYVKSMNVVLGSSPHIKCTCGVVGYNDNVYISFGRNVKEAAIERHVFTRLIKMGVRVKLKSN